MMQLGAEGVFVGSGIFKSGNPAKRAASIVKAVTNYTDAKLIAELSADLGEAMVGINEQEIALLMGRKRKIMKIGVLALQGAFAEHEKVLEQLDAECIELRQARDLSEPYDALVLPGGESTVQGKLLKELGMFDTIKSQIENGMPVLATCAGAILLAETIDGQIKGQPEQYFGHDSDVHQAGMPTAAS